MTAMIRRDFLAGAGAGTIAALVLPTPSYAAPPGSTRSFNVATTVELPAGGKSAELWLPLFQSTDNQDLVDLRFSGNGKASVRRDLLEGATVLHTRWSNGDEPMRLSVVQRVETWARGAGRSTAISLTPPEHARWTAPGEGVSPNGIVRETAMRILGDRREPKAQLRALFDWVAANTWRDARVPGCGRGDVEQMLKTGNLGGKCVDINRLMVALARAVGLPARELYGIRLANSRRFPSLGRSGDVTVAQHCRAEVHLPGEGWFAVDPADVRKAMLEEKLSGDDPRIVALAEALFGTAEDNWAAYNSAAGWTIPGGAELAQFDFLMYPTARVDERLLDCLAPAEFSYRIASSEVTA
jgi:transglutaminase-like putative cysteine protease